MVNPKLAFTIGFDGNTAIIDKNNSAGFSKLTSIDLAQKGFFKAAVTKAIYDQDELSLAKVMDLYNELAGKYGKATATKETVKRLFGIYEDLEAGFRTLYL